jgi:PAS domain S-box-containing protein
MPEKPTYEELEQRIEELEQAESERNQAEEALHDREERFRELADSLPQIVFETDEKGIITYANRNAFAYFGYTESELENNLNALQMISPEDRDRAVENIQKVFNGEILEGIEYTALRKNGNTFPVEIHSKIISRTNKPIGLRGIIVDLSKRKQMEEALKESEEKFRNIAEISLAGIYIIQDGIFMYVNKKWAEIFGYSVEECLNNMNIRQTVHPEDLDVVREQISKRISGKANFANYTFRGIKKNGETIHVEIFGSTIQLNGKPAVSGSVLDITERKRAEEERDKLVAELQKTLSEVKTLRGFLPICSHCKKIRDDKGYWNQIESYIHKHSDAEFSHGICPECAEKYYPEMDLYGKNET